LFFFFSLPVRIAAYEAVEKLLERLTSPLSLKVTPSYTTIQAPTQTPASGAKVEETGGVGQSSVFTTISSVPLFDYNVWGIMCFLIC
jgi:hypothetical protein